MVLKVNLFFGSFLSIPTNKDLKGSVTKPGICILHFPIASNNLYTLSPSNGYSPVTKLYLKKKNYKNYGFVLVISIFL